jgi:hypothetical protein
MNIQQQPVLTRFPSEIYVELSKIAATRGWAVGRTVKFLIEFSLDNIDDFDEWLKKTAEKRVKAIAAERNT